MLENASFKSRQGFDAKTPGDSRILIADDDPRCVGPLQEALTFESCDVITASDGEESVREVHQNSPGLFLPDAEMPKVSGYVVCAYLKANQRTRPIRVILAANQRTAQDIVAGVGAACNDFLPKPEDEDVLVPTVKFLPRTARPTDNMVDIEDVLTIPSRASELKEGYSNNHVDRVAAYALFLGAALGISFEEKAALRRGALLHDIGKLGISESILLKEGPLDVEEREEVNLHPSLGESICRRLGQARPILDVVRHHHERFDGKGYPDGLKGESIPLLARITAIADAYDAMTNHRCYQEKLPHSSALETIQEEAGRQFDPNLALAFCNSMKLG